MCVISAAFGLADAHVQGGMVGDLSFMQPEIVQVSSNISFLVENVFLTMLYDNYFVVGIFVVISSGSCCIGSYYLGFEDDYQRRV